MGFLGGLNGKKKKKENGRIRPEEYPNHDLLPKQIVCHSNAAHTRTVRAAAKRDETFVTICLPVNNEFAFFAVVAC